MLVVVAGAGNAGPWWRRSARGGPPATVRVEEQPHAAATHPGPA